MKNKIRNCRGVLNNGIQLIKWFTAKNKNYL